jgi:hypothetical protein
MMAEDCNIAFKQWLEAYNCHLNEVATSKSNQPDGSDPLQPAKLDAASEKER